MKTQPFSIESFEAGDAHWVVVPTQSGDEVQLCLDMGGGEGPIVALAEWIPSRALSEFGFLSWQINGELVVNDPRWVPPRVKEAIKRMAKAIHDRHEAERRAER